MTRDEFAVQIMKRFPKVDSVVIDDLLEWMDSVRIKDFQLQTVLNMIKTRNEYSTFPPLGKVIKWWAEQSGTGVAPQAVNEHVLADWGQRSSLDIYRHIVDIKARHVATGMLSNGDIDFLATWEIIGYFVDTLRYMEWEERRIESYVDSVRNAIVRGENVSCESLAKIEIKFNDERKTRTQHISKVMAGVA